MNTRIYLGLALAPTMILLGALSARAMDEPVATPAVPEASTAVEAPPQAKAAVAQFMQGGSVFIENDGQWADPEIRFALDGVGANVGLTNAGPKFQLFRKKAVPSAVSGPSDPVKALRDTPPPPEMHAFGLIFDGAATVVPVGRDHSESTFNYTIGAPENRHEGVPSFNSVWYENVYPGVSLEMTGRRSGVKYNFHVAPGADWKSIRLRYENIQGLALQPDGAMDIRVKDGWNTITDGAPYIYQEINGTRKAVTGAFRLFDDHCYGFEITGAYDGTLPLVIDPAVDWSTYLGGTGYDEGRGIAVDSSGNVYVTGATASSGWVKNSDFNGGAYDAFVVKLNAAGGHVWSTYLGAKGDDEGLGIALDGNDNVFVVGFTDSPGWVSGGWDTSQNGGQDGFVVKLDTAGAHVWSTYLGGTGTDRAYGIAADDGGNVCVTGSTDSTKWVEGGWNTTLGGGVDGFVVRLTSVGDLDWSTYLGGADNDYGYAIAVEPKSGNAYVTGTTYSSGWTSGGWDTSQNGAADGFVVKLGKTGDHLWSTYLGGVNPDQGYGIAVDGDGNAYVTGYTTSAGWVSGGWDTTFAAGWDAFVVKLSVAGAHLWSTYLGGTGYNVGQGIALGSGGNVYVMGYTNSADWVSGGWDTTLNGGYDACVVKLTAAGAHLWSSYLGGTGDEIGYGIAVDANGSLYVTGRTYSADWVGGGWDTTYGGGCDAFVAKISQAITGTIKINNDAISTNNVNVSLSLTWLDGTGAGVTRMRFSNDGSTWTAWEVLQATRAYTLPAGDGYKTVRVQFLDAANNRSAVFNDYIRLDTVPPTGTIIINGGAATTTSRSVSLGLTWADTGSGVTRMRFSDNGSTWTAWESQRTTRAYTLPAGLGYHTVRVQYTDGASNYSVVYNDYIKLVAP